MNNSTLPPVSTERAIEMTENWRAYYSRITDTDPDKALRAFKIPLTDLLALVELAKQEQNITSVRAYLALGTGVTSGVVDSEQVHILLVPVKDATPTTAGTDVLETKVDGTQVSTIMDFTTPCPSMCDTRSPLY